MDQLVVTVQPERHASRPSEALRLLSTTTWSNVLGPVTAKARRSADKEELNYTWVRKVAQVTSVKKVAKVKGRVAGLGGEYRHDRHDALYTAGDVQRPQPLPHRR